MSQLQLENEDYHWLLEALGGAGEGPRQPTLARPTASNPELLLPLGSAAAGAAALRRFHDGRTRNERVKTVAATALARVGLLRFAPGERVEISSFTLVEQINEALGENDVQIAITLGPRRRNRKPVLQLLRRNGDTIGFAKVGWSPFTRALVENEAHWLERLAGAVPDEICIPTVLARIDGDDRTIVVSSALDTSLRAGLGGRLSSHTITRLARCLGTDRVRFTELPLLEALRAGRVGELIDVDCLLRRHGDVEVELGTWHGDLTPWNTSTVDGVSRVWDWEFADAHRPVGFDLLHNAFELVRRQRSHNEEAALVAVRDQADAILAPIGQPSAATLDLYLCELIMREARLTGEGWDPEELGPLEAHAAAMLKQRLA